MVTSSVDFKNDPHQKIFKHLTHQGPSPWEEERTQLLQDIQETHQPGDLTTLHTGWFTGLISLSQTSLSL